MTDEQLIEQCRSGRAAAFNELVERHQDRLFASLYKMLGNADEAQDAVQDAFILAFQKLETFSGRSAFSTWLYRVAVNAAFSQKRREKRRPQSLSTASGCRGIDPTDQSPASDPAAPLEQMETQRKVNEALQGLSEEFRAALVLKEIDGFRYDEIAEILDIPIGTVRSRIFRAREELREKLRSLLAAEV